MQRRILHIASLLLAGLLLAGTVFFVHPFGLGKSGKAKADEVSVPGYYSPGIYQGRSGKMYCVNMYVSAAGATSYDYHITMTLYDSDMQQCITSGYGGGIVDEFTLLGGSFYTASGPLAACVGGRHASASGTEALYSSNGGTCQDDPPSQVQVPRYVAPETPTVTPPAPTETPPTNDCGNGVTISSENATAAASSIQEIGDANGWTASEIATVQSNPCLLTQATWEQLDTDNVKTVIDIVDNPIEVAGVNPLPPGLRCVTITRRFPIPATVPVINRRFTLGYTVIKQPNICTDVLDYQSRFNVAALYGLDGKSAPPPPLVYIEYTVAGRVEGEIKVSDVKAFYEQYANESLGSWVIQGITVPGRVTLSAPYIPIAVGLNLNQQPFRIAIIAADIVNCVSGYLCST